MIPTLFFLYLKHGDKPIPKAEKSSDAHDKPPPKVHDHKSSGASSSWKRIGYVQLQRRDRYMHACSFKMSFKLV